MSQDSSTQRRGKPPHHWSEMSSDERQELLQQWRLPSYRLGQLLRHYFERYSADPLSWTDLPASARESVRTAFPVLLEPVAQTLADRGKTVKNLYRLFDGVLVESVVMRYSRGEGTRSTLCISSQAGCGIGCPFCATGQLGLQRNLTVGEICEQVRLAVVDLGSAGAKAKLNNVVFMGMGEPLANYDTVMSAIRRITSESPHGFGITARGVTVSTAGIVPRIADLAGEGLPLTLAISLHAPDDELREKLVPLNKRWGVGDVLDAARDYFRTTSRRVSIEYALMKGVNDQVWRAELLAKKLNALGRGWVHVNVIPLNPTPGSPWQPSTRQVTTDFMAILDGARIPVTLRDSRGQDIDGGCGQLAGRQTWVEP
ncbi:MAG: 23S rRNA (adenine(2503)-C(2))-methyltransferase RlmN [Propionibacteriaceae bacterium]|nr:23S rRNA (adenine(2503)-C(2))-methyltransferase RlmN [Propionibacteriaceae bacterium]